MSTASTEYVESRRRRILDAAQRCFVRNGLHGTSMEDVSRESGLPEEEVTHYFESRDDLVQGIAENILGLVSAFFDELRNETPVPPLDEIVERFAETVIELSGPEGPGHLAPIYWASALYNAEMAERARAPIGRARRGWIEIATRQRAAGALTAGADPRAVGTLLVCLLPGILLQRILFDDVDAADLRRGVRALFGPDVRWTDA